MRGISLAVSIAALILSPALILGQASPGALTGTITDAAGAPLSGATVRIADVITGAEHTARQ